MCRCGINAWLVSSGESPDGTGESFRTQPNPFASDTLPAIAVIADAEVFLEVFAGVLEVVLRFGSNHAPKST